MSVAPEGILPVVVIDRAAHAVRLAEALVRGGVSTVEVTLRTAAALDAISAMRTVPGLTVGAGTVRTPKDVRAAVAAGAQFLVSPGLDLEVVQVARQQGVEIVPGVATASEVQSASRQGLQVVKVFPAALLGGAAYLRALAGPFPDLRFLPSGGITAETARAYLEVPAVAAVCGSWMVEPALLERGDWDEVTHRTALSVETASR